MVYIRKGMNMRNHVIHSISYSTRIKPLNGILSYFQHETLKNAEYSDILNGGMTIRLCTYLY